MALVAFGLLAFTAPASAAVSSAGGFTYVTKRASLGAPATPGAYSKVSASCPRRMHVLGGGHYNNRGFGVVEAAHSGPYDNRDAGRKPDDGWRAVLYREDQATVTAYAVCAPTMPTYERRRVLVEGGATVTVRPRCSSTGEEPTSGGTAGSESLRQTVSGPYVPDRWTLVVENTSSGARRMSATTVCVPFDVDHIVEAPSVAAPESQASTSCLCPANRHVLGGGQRYEPGGVLTVASRPLGFSSAAADGWEAWIDNFNAGERSFQAYAVCARPRTG